MRKKTVALLTAAVLLLGIFTGCAQSPSSSAGPAGASSTGTSSAGEKENYNKEGYPVVNEPITITAVGFHNPATEGDPKDLSYWQTLEKITNIHINWTLVDSTVDSATNLFFAAGDYPDFFHNGVDSKIQVTYGVEGGIFADLSGYLEECCPNMTALFKEFPLAEKVIRQVDGKVYTLPRIQVASTSAKGQMFFRTDYLDQLNLDTPKTIDDYHNALVKIKDAGLTEGYSPLLPYSASHFDQQLEVFLFPAFGDSIDPDFADAGDGKTVVYNRTSEQYRRYLEFMNKLYQEKLLDNEYFTLDTAVTMARVKSGQAAFFTFGSNLLPEDYKDGVVHLDCLAPLTSEYTDKQQVQAYDYVTTYAGAINKDSKYIREILRMIDANYSEEMIGDTGFNSMSQNLGIYDVDWHYLNDEKTAYELIVPKDWDQSPWIYKSLHGSWAQFYSYYNAKTMLSDKDSSPNNYARELGMTTNNMPNAVTPFPDALMKYTNDEAADLASKFTDIDSYVAQMKSKFISGVVPLSDWDSYVKEIEKMGIADVIAIKQAAYDRWNA